MNRSNAKFLVIGIILSSSVSLSSCKGKAKETQTTTPTETAPTTPAAPVEIAEDDALTKGVKDATKDYPGVTAVVSDGEITLTGEIQRTKLPDLMQTLNSLRPKKINNQLTIK